MGAKHVLVTGGSGYVGSHACKALAEAGLVPVVYDNLCTGHRWAVQWGPFEQGDLQDGARLDEVFARYRPASVMHFAALACVAESFSDPAAYFRSNVTGSLVLLEAMRRNGVMDLVFSSSCAVYGQPDGGTIAEDATRRPLNPYGSSKLMVELMLEHYRRMHGLRFVALRYFNAAGADPGGAIGEHHAPETHLIPLLLDVAAGKRECIEIYGEDYETGDGTCIRDYVHVADIAQAHLLALRHLESNDAAVFNLGNSRGTSVREIIALAERITGRPIAVKSAARRPGDAPALVADASRIRRQLGWRAESSNPETILETAWQWHRRHHGAG